MKVLKFGGTSVGSVAAIKSVASIINSASTNNNIVVVVSAIGGVTNQLIQLSTRAQQGDTSYEALIDQLKLQHTTMYSELLGKEEEGFINELFSQLSEVCKGVFLLKELTSRTSDFIQSCGERLSSFIVFSYLKNEKVDITLYDSRKYLITDKQFGNANILIKETSELLLGLKSEMGSVSLFPGFIASTLENETTTLGRGGSDYTASLLANVFEAEALEIWTDVNGLMTADPRLVKQAHLLPHVSYEEALELSHFGAKVLYPPSIQPALDKGITIWVKNTFDAEGECTKITKEWDEKKNLVRGISSIKEIALLNLSGNSMVGIPSFSFRLFRALSEARVNVILITQASSEHSICVAISTVDVDKAKEAVNKEFRTELELRKLNAVSIDTDMSILALVGANMKNQVGICGKMFDTLGRNGISVTAIAQGSSERNISAVIHRSDMKKAINLLHESFFLSEIKKVHLFIVGVGNVGRAFLNQISEQQEYLLKEHHLNILVAGIANSKQSYFEEEGIDLKRWTDLLNGGDAYHIDSFVSRIDELNLRNSVFVDITASKDIAQVYQAVLEKSISVVTPNKIAATRSMEQYRKLKQTARKYGAQFLFETNVAAGLPVISTLNDLIKSGDKILSIEAVLSGTLNYLFNEYNGQSTFRSIIESAKALGLTEPDPRLDLSGEDVIRKLLILMRESGLEVEMKDVDLVSFLPEGCLEAPSLDSFYQKVEDNEPYFKALYNEAEQAKTKLRVVASYKNGKATVGLQKIEEGHPFYFLEGKDNIVLFHTERYKTQPLVIKGAGAGAEVTASGIFADVLRLVNN